LVQEISAELPLMKEIPSKKSMIILNESTSDLDEQLLKKYSTPTSKTPLVKEVSSSRCSSFSQAELESTIPVRLVQEVTNNPIEKASSNVQLAKPGVKSQTQAEKKLSSGQQSPIANRHNEIDRSRSSPRRRSPSATSKKRLNTSTHALSGKRVKTMAMPDLNRTDSSTTIRSTYSQSSTLSRKTLTKNEKSNESSTKSGSCK
jgi:hypothetical protein